MDIECTITFVCRANRGLSYARCRKSTIDPCKGSVISLLKQVVIVSSDLKKSTHKTQTIDNKTVESPLIVVVAKESIHQTKAIVKRLTTAINHHPKTLK